MVLSVVLATQILAGDKPEIEEKNATKSKFILPTIGGDVDMSFETLNKKCNKGELNNCNNLGVIYKKGTGVKKDINKATEIFKSICDKGYIHGCENLAFVYYEKKEQKSYKKAAPLFQKVCDQNEFPACVALGYMNYMGYGVEKNITKSKKLYNKGCKGGFKAGCQYLKAIDIYEKKSRTEKK